MQELTRSHPLSITEQLNFSWLCGLADDMIEIGKALLEMQYHVNVYMQGSKVCSDADIFAETEIIERATRHAEKLGVQAVFYSEETYKTLPNMRTLPLVLVVDPIDGSRFYLGGMPDFAISIAIYVFGKLIGAIVILPAYRECFVAQNGQGTLYKRGDDPWTVFQYQTPVLPMIGISTSYSVAANPNSWATAGSISRGHPSVFSKPTTLMVLEVVRRRAHACVLLYEAMLWDIAGVLLIAQETGCAIGCRRGVRLSRTRERMPHMVFATSETTLTTLRWYLAPKQ